MSLFNLLRKLIGGSAGDATPSSNDCAVATLEAGATPGNDSLAGDETPVWWQPRTKAGAIASAPACGPIDEELYNSLTAALDDGALQLPRLPQVTNRALGMLREGVADYQKLAKVVEQDAALTAEVLRIANSTAFRGFSHIKSLELAFARLGQRTLRGLILGVTVKSLSIRTGGPQRSLGEELWRRSLASGVVLGSLGPRFGIAEDDAFLVGLLHDIGMLAILKVAHEHQQRGGGRLDRPVFDRLCGQWHEHVGLRLADAWSLPDPLPELIGNHHREPAEDDPLRTYRLLIGVSDAVCSLLEYSPYAPLDFFGLPCVQRLGLVDDVVTRELLLRLPQQISNRIEAF